MNATISYSPKEYYHTLRTTVVKLKERLNATVLTRDLMGCTLR
jgi:hypothetical protein